MDYAQGVFTLWESEEAFRHTSILRKSGRQARTTKAGSVLGFWADGLSGFAVPDLLQVQSDHREVVIGPSRLCRTAKSLLASRLACLFVRGNGVCVCVCVCARVSALRPGQPVRPKTSVRITSFSKASRNRRGEFWVSEVLGCQRCVCRKENSCRRCAERHGELRNRGPPALFCFPERNPMVGGAG